MGILGREQNVFCIVKFWEPGVECYGLDVRCPPKTHMWDNTRMFWGEMMGCKHLKPISDLIPWYRLTERKPSWKVWLEEEEIGAWLWGVYLFLVSGEPSLCFLFIMWVASLCHTLLPWCSASPWALRNGADLLWTETSETVSPPNKPFLLYNCAGYILLVTAPKYLNKTVRLL